MQRNKECAGRWWCDIDRDRAKNATGWAVFLIAVSAFFITTVYSSWYNANNATVVDTVKAKKIDTDMWGRWVTLDSGNRWHVDDNAWTTIRVNDTVAVYATWPAWEPIIAHRISIS